MAGRLRDYYRTAPRHDEHDVDPRDLFYLPDGIYKAVRRAPIYGEKTVKDGRREVVVSSVVATAVKVVKIRSLPHDAGSRQRAASTSKRRSPP